MAKVKLGDVAREYKATVKDAVDLPVVGLEHLIPGQVELTQWSEDADNTFTKGFQKGQMLFGRRRAYLKKAALAPFDGICSGDITVIEAIPERIMPELLPFVIQNDSLFDYAVEKSAGSLSPRVKWEHLKNYEFELPEMEHQRELVDLLWAMTRTKKAYQELLKKTDELVKSQFIEMFGDVSTGEYNYPTERLGDVADVGSSHRVFTTEFVESGIPFYRGTEIGELANGQQPSDPFFITEEHYQRLASDDSKPKIGDILLPSICNKGQVWMVDTDEPFYYKDGRVLCISGNRDLFNTRYLQFYMKLKTEVEYPKMGSGSTFAEFKIFMLKDMDVIMPPKANQDQFALFWEQSDKSKFELTQAISRIDDMIKALMQG